MISRKIQRKITRIRTARNAKHKRSLRDFNKKISSELKNSFQRGTAGILFVCQENMSRSQGFEFSLRKALLARGINTIRISSAGTNAESGKPIVRMRRQLIEGGYPLEPVKDARTTKLTTGLVERNNLILVVDQKQKAKILTQDENAAYKVFTINEFIYGKKN
ncbi:MAG: hypothetical protein NUV57_00045, partial [archaeon]|nr:hypothetical protein [archaeon]